MMAAAAAAHGSKKQQQQQQLLLLAFSLLGVCKAQLLGGSAGYDGPLNFADVQRGSIMPYSGSLYATNTAQSLQPTTTGSIGSDMLNYGGQVSTPQMQLNSASSLGSNHPEAVMQQILTQNNQNTLTPWPQAIDPTGGLGSSQQNDYGQLPFEWAESLGDDSKLDGYQLESAKEDTGSRYELPPLPADYQQGQASETQATSTAPQASQAEFDQLFAAMLGNAPSAPASTNSSSQASSMHDGTPAPAAKSKLPSGDNFGMGQPKQQTAATADRPESHELQEQQWQQWQQPAPAETQKADVQSSVTSSIPDPAASGSMRLELAAPRQEPSEAEVQLIPTAETDFTEYVPTSRGLPSDLDKLNTQSVGLLSTKKAARSVTPLMPPAADVNKSKSALSTGACIGIAAGGCVVAAVTVMFVMRTVRKAKARKDATDGANEVDMEQYFSKYSCDTECDLEAAAAAAPGSACSSYHGSCHSPTRRTRAEHCSIEGGPALSAQWWKSCTVSRDSSYSSGQGSDMSPMHHGRTGSPKKQHKGL